MRNKALIQVYILLAVNNIIATGQTSTKNFVITEIPLVSVSTESALDALSYQGKTKTINYYDGFGNLIQTNEYKASPDGTKDLITPKTYDSFQRLSKEYLPYGATASGLFSTTSTSPTNWTNYYGTIDDDYSFSENSYEKSNLNRLEEKSYPGYTWRTGGGYTSKQSYHFNLSNDNVRIWIIDNDNLINPSPYYYPEKSLKKVVGTDENSNKTIQFIDISGKILLERKYYDASSYVSTYYVYDDRDLLRIVIAPKANGDGGVVDSTALAELCFQYKYDERKRLVEKKIPGAGWEYLIYDYCGRLALRQDAKLRSTSSNKYFYTKYDVRNRPVEEGICTESMDYASLRNSVKTVSSYNPVNCDPLHFYYYDDYSITDTWGMPYSTVYGEIVRLTSVRGLLTGEKVKVLGTTTWLKSVVYYDKFNRVIQTKKDLYDSSTGLETISNNYDFSGNKIQTRQVQIFSQEDVTVDKTYQYDHKGRLLTIQNQIINDTRNGNVTLTQNTYNELGQLITKKLHKVSEGVYAQELNYAYNVRTWLSAINDPDNQGSDLFAMKLFYENNSSISPLVSSPQYNGNISGIKWKNGAMAVKGYGFSYDALYRMTGSDFGEGVDLLSQADRFNEILTYDPNGNIMTLSRTGYNGATYFSNLDVLSYSYYDNGNKLRNITDNGQDLYGFIDVDNASDYDYDPNGNLKQDLNKGISEILYNDLNLPSEIKKDATHKVVYSYDATGKKVKKQVIDGATITDRYYSGIFEYNTNKMLDLIHTDEGIAYKITSTSYDYEYHLKDHLGNVRHAFMIRSGAALTSQYTEYYPFGTISKYWISGSSHNKYLYNGNELQDDQFGAISLGWYDYGARFYDPQIGRTQIIDPHAENYYFESPYSFLGNNPIMNIDPDGMDWYTNWFTGKQVWFDGSDKHLFYSHNEGGYYSAPTVTVSTSSKATDHAVTEAVVARMNTEYYLTHECVVDPNDIEHTSAFVAISSVFSLGALPEFKGISILTRLFKSKSILGKSFGKLGTVIENPKITAKMLDEKGHYLKGKITREVPSADVISTLKEPLVVLQQSNNRYLYISSKAAVAISQDGKLITVYGQSNFDANILNILNEIGH